MIKIDKRELFSQKRIKVTDARNLIYDILNHAKLPVTAEDIFILVRESDSNMNLSTVYRVLELFVEKQIAIKSILGDKNKAIYELDKMEHKHHLVCIGCKKMFLMEDCPFGDYEKRIEDKLGFEVRGHKLEIYGVCITCKNTNSI